MPVLIVVVLCDDSRPTTSRTASLSLSTPRNLAVRSSVSSAVKFAYVRNSGDRNPIEVRTSGRDIEPSLGGSRTARRRSNVLLPLPFAPVTSKHWPGSRLTSKRRKSQRFPYRFPSEAADNKRQSMAERYTLPP